MSPLAGLVVRPLRPADADLLDRLLAAMSPQSRYRRFHAAKPRLTARERAYLAGADQRDHLALIALAPDGTPVAVVRGVRLADEPVAAEMGVEVADAWQGRGIGTVLIAELARRARRAGIVRLTANVLADGPFAAGLARRGWRRTGCDGRTVSLEASTAALAIAAAPAPPEERPLAA